jgi:hypothetical protein
MDSQLTGLPATYGNANVAAYLPTYTGNLIALAGNVITTANVTGGNILTGGAVSATANVTGGNIVTGGAVSAIGVISAVANVTGGNINTGAQVWPQATSLVVTFAQQVK